MKKLILAAGIALLLLPTTTIGSIALGPGGAGTHDDRGPPGRGGGAPPPEEMGAMGVITLALRLDLTPDQQKLLEALQDANKQVRATFPRLGGFDPDVGIIQRMHERVEIMRAQADALESLIPAAEAFMKSLTPEQLKQIESFRPTPQKPGSGGGIGGGSAGGGEGVPPPPAN